MPRSDKKVKRSTTTAKRRLDFGDGYQQDANGDVVVEKSIRNSFESDVGISVKEMSSVISATPKKKRRCGDFPNRNHKHGIGDYFSPARATTTIDARKKSVLVTPEKEEAISKVKDSIEKTDSQQYVPIYIHKNLNYKRRGQAFLDKTLKCAFDLVEKNYVIPSDFENDRSYGPLSGTCFEERVVNAYDRGLLLPNVSSDCGILICINCAKIGHQQDDCPDLI